MTPIDAQVEHDGATWRVELIPLESVRVWRGDVEVPHVGWDRMRLSAPRHVSEAALSALTRALRAAIDLAESPPPRDRPEKGGAS